MNEILREKEEELKAICRKMKVKRLYAFGSVTSGKFFQSSDIDFLFSFLDNVSIEEYTSNYFDLHYEIRKLFNRRIDLITERSLSNPYFIENINATKKLIYED